MVRPCSKRTWRRRLWLLECLGLLVVTFASAESPELLANVKDSPKGLRSSIPFIVASTSAAGAEAKSFILEERDLKSSSDSRDDHDDYWRRPADYDDYVRGNGDDDFYAYIEDQIPPSLLPLSSRQIVGFMLASLGVVLGSSGGIGGGGIVVPVYIIVIGLSPRDAIPLGSVTVLGGALAGFLTNLKRRHPLADRPIIDWDLILVMEPLVLVGALIGSMLHRVVSEKILMVLLVLLLSVVAHTTLTKARRMYDAEGRYIEHLKAARWDNLSRVTSFKSMGEWSSHAVQPGEASPSKASSTLEQGHSPVRTMTFDSVPTVPTKLDADEKQRILIVNPDFVTLRSDILEQEKVTPHGKILIMFAKFAIIMFLNITLGGGAFRSPWGILCGSVAYWVVHIIMVAFLLASAWAAQTYLINRYELKEIVRFDYVHGDIKWDLRNALIYPFFFMTSGVCAGMFGIGGGMICVPLMLAMGVHPGVVTATASAMIFFSTALSTTSYAVFNFVKWDYAIVCFIIGFFASLVGQAIIRRAKKGAQVEGANFERNSFIAYCIGGVILVSALLMTMQYVLNIVTYDHESSESEMGGLCEGYRL
eukprot:scaffold1561_cov129-Cylindrotheca_fusiformis.AAC.25